MTEMPKPTKRGPKPRRRIASKSKRAPVGKGRKRAKRVSKRRASRTKMMELCDKLHSVTVRLLGGGRCKLCGRAAGQACQCAHLISRGKFSVRWELENCWCLCPQCHTRYTHDPEGWQELMMDTFGADGWRARIRAARVAVGPPLYEEIIPLLVEELEGAHHAVPYDALTEGLHERAREVLAKAEKMGFEVTR